ncbi:MAG: hypothetical protein AB7O04_09440 [Hyphomonadaceae bacterium]
MAKGNLDPIKPRGLFWPTLGLILFLLIWLVTCGAGFWYIYQGIAGQSSEPDVALRALQWMTWPFTVLTVAGPLLLILSIGGLRVVRDLLEMQKLMIGLPSQVEMMQTTVVEFRALRTQLITDVSRVNDATADSDPDAASSVNERPEVQEFLHLYERAKQFFYSALEDHNTSAPEPLIVRRGGANFSEIATSLREHRAFARSDDRNGRIAKFVTRAFELERSTRRSGRANLSSTQVHELQNLGAAV